MKNSLIDNNTHYTRENPTIVANHFVDYFTDLGNIYADRIKAKPKSRDQSSTNDLIIEDSIEMNPIAENEIDKYINELKDMAAPGVDNIETKTIKAIKIYIVQPLTHIFNICLDTNTFPDSFKLAIIKPIFKAKEKYKTENYRPISLLTHFSKLLEKCIKHRLITFFNYNNIISKSQFGFLNNLSTQDAIHSLTSKISSSIDLSLKSIAIFLDLAKAFDTVDHQILIQKLHNVGIRGSPLQLIESYLSNRTQHVKIDNHLSKPRTLSVGVPQGTVLGPILFLIYINDLCNIHLNGRLVSYADDTALIFTGSTLESTIHTAETELKKVYEWLDNNLLTLNLSKTIYMTFFNTHSNNKNNDNPVSIRMHESTCKDNDHTCNCYKLVRVEQTKYLGIIIDETLKWKPHIQSIIRKIRLLAYKFYRLRSILNISNLKLLYYAIVQSYLQYAIIGWRGVLDTHLNPLQVLQNYIVKIILNHPKYYSTNCIYDEAKLLTIRQLYLKTLLLHTFKNQHILKNVNNIHNTRNTQIRLPISRKHTSFGQKQSDYLGPKFFNTLPNDLILSKDYDTFKYKLHTWILTLNLNHWHALLDKHSSAFYKTFHN